ncbi:MAG: hypothetical protein PUB21_06690 [Bacteroidales bacterium]|nr:hypothetical protein [Bacteroidales bacterium]
MKFKVYLLIAIIFLPGIISARQLPAKKKHEVSFSWGIAPVSSFIGIYSGLIPTIFSFGKEETHNMKVPGAFNFGYTYHARSWLGVGCIYTYSRYSQDIYKSSRNIRLRREAYNYHSIMPMVKLSWLHLGSMVTFYSRFGAGMMFSHQKSTAIATKEEEKDNFVFFSYQISPLGFEIGKKWGFYVEGGFGELGALQLGMRYRFK